MYSPDWKTLPGFRAARTSTRRSSRRRTTLPSTTGVLPGALRERSARHWQRNSRPTASQRAQRSHPDPPDQREHRRRSPSPRRQQSKYHDHDVARRYPDQGRPTSEATDTARLCGAARESRLLVRPLPGHRRQRWHAQCAPSDGRMRAAGASSYFQPTSPAADFPSEASMTQCRDRSAVDSQHIGAKRRVAPHRARACVILAERAAARPDSLPVVRDESAARLNHTRLTRYSDVTHHGDATACERIDREQRLVAAMIDVNQVVEFALGHAGRDSRGRSNGSHQRRSA